MFRFLRLVDLKEEEEGDRKKRSVVPRMSYPVHYDEETNRKYPFVPKLVRFTK